MPAKLTKPASNEISYYDLPFGRLAVVTAWKQTDNYVGAVIQRVPASVIGDGPFAMILGGGHLGSCGHRTDDNCSRVRLLEPGEQITV